MGIESASYTNRTDETFPVTNSDQLLVSRLPYIFYKNFLFFLINNIRLTINNCFVRSTFLHQKNSKTQRLNDFFFLIRTSLDLEILSKSKDSKIKKKLLQIDIYISI